MIEKKCGKCGKIKGIDEFYRRKNGYCSQCKECMRETNRIWHKEHPIEAKSRREKWHKENRERANELRQLWKEKNKEYIKDYKRQKYHKDKLNKEYKLKIQVRHLITKAFERKGYKKETRTEQIIGCDYETFIKNLLETYKNNYGVEWNGKEPVHIDHIIPLATAKTENEIIMLNHYTNLQLLKASDNLHKSNKLDWGLNNDK